MRRGRPEALSMTARKTLYEYFVRFYPFWFDVLRIIPRFSGGSEQPDLLNTVYVLSSWARFTGREKEAAKLVLKDLLGEGVRPSSRRSTEGRASPRYLAFEHAVTLMGLPLVGIRQLERYIAPFRTVGDTDVELKPLPPTPARD